MDVEVVEAPASRIERHVRAALGGSERASRAYARAWRDLVDAMLARHPDVPSGASDVLRQLALVAPFDPSGPVGALMSAASAIIPSITVAVSSPTWLIEVPEKLDYRRFSRFVQLELAGAGTGLERLLAAWELTVTDLGRLFGVRRQAVQQWLDEGVPPSRQPKLSVVHRIADLLERNLLPGRIPAVVRMRAEALDGASMLELIAADRHDHLLAIVERSVDWAATA